jgi:hypothetical protein
MSTTLLAPSARPATATATVTRVGGQLRLTHPTRGYAVTRNPFAVWSILPSITLAFAGLAIAVPFINDAYIASIAVSAFLAVTTGLLLIPAVALRGSLNLTHDGVTFARGKHHLTAGWDQVTGVIYRRDAGLCLVFRDPQQTKAVMKLPGGFSARDEEARIPLRMFGDRQFSILYDIRDRLPEAAWRPALERADNRSQLRILAVYAATVAVCGASMFAVMYSVTH